jgi:hypothetical protein
MIIKTLEHMEKVVENNKTLYWDGWTVVNSIPSDKARSSANGALVNGKWHIQTRYEANRTGWDIPSKFVETNG